MRISVPTEIKDNEYRVALTPAGVHDLVASGHQVFVQRGAGAGSSMADAEYEAAGATLLGCLLYTSPSPRDATLSRMPSSA